MLFSSSNTCCTFLSFKFNHKLSMPSTLLQTWKKCHFVAGSYSYLTILLLPDFYQHRNFSAIYHLSLFPLILHHCLQIFNLLLKFWAFQFQFSAKYSYTKVKIIFRSLYAVLEIPNEDSFRNDTEKVNFPKEK